jgi:HD-GYP domain-containing protein (c-di-GMP phosphodiesterase class II)
MAQEMHLPGSLAEQIEFGAMLHDIGKLGIPESILSKSDALSVEEYAIVKRHPAIGYQMLRHVDFLRAVAPIVLYHHEWVNGDGYPEGLAGEEIPLGARMVAIVDAWDAMTTPQPYRKALSRSAAIAELRQQAGAQFDPKLVDIFLHVVERKPAGSVPSAAAQANA